MKNTLNSALIIGILGASLLTVSCAKNPADDVDAAKTSDAAPAAEKTDAAVEAATYTIGGASKLEWVGSKVTNSHEGGFKMFSGTLSTAADGTLSGASVTIDMDSTFSDSAKLTGHLKSPDFFDVAKFKQATFEMTSSEPGAGPSQITLVGNFTLHGVTKQITFPAQVSASKELVTLKAEFSINRLDFGVAYKGRVDDLIREEVVIKANFQATR
ncbi:MAG TPA: YceI family protein [Lentisphaeria bacterium]|nr:YceI family protein [Lentisphaeria bacterium]